MAMLLSRRQVLHGATAVGFAAAGLSPVSAETPRRIPHIDSHLHCFAGKDDRRFPYDERAPYTPDKAATPEHLLDCMAKAGVDFAMVVHPEPYQDDHRYLEHCLSVGKGKLKGTLLQFADREG
jgi:hypothetical protein